MRRVILTPQAQEDLTEIWLYIAEDDPVAADRMADAIEGACLRLGRNPKLGPARPDIARGLRYVPVGRYLVLYRIIEGAIEVVRIVHGARFLRHLI
ncbi:MAG: type II toxin-antitoxin system RelE/ParE family toxin [Acidobacteriota bacterium]